MFPHSYSTKVDLTIIENYVFRFWQLLMGVYSYNVGGYVKNKNRTFGVIRNEYAFIPNFLAILLLVSHK